MCSSPKIPAPPPPPQEIKQPDTSNLTDKAKRNRTGISGGTLLTGSSGVASVPTGQATLLGQ